MEKIKQSAKEESEERKLIQINEEIASLLSLMRLTGYEGVVIFRKEDKLFPTEVFFESSSNPDGTMEMLSEIIIKHTESSSSFHIHNSELTIK